jgi:hypothetical protein
MYAHTRTSGTWGAHGVLEIVQKVSVSEKEARTFCSSAETALPGVASVVV